MLPKNEGPGTVSSVRRAGRVAIAGGNAPHHTTAGERGHQAKFGVWAHRDFFRWGAHSLLVRRHEKLDYVWAQVDDWPEFPVRLTQLKHHHRFVNVAFHQIRTRMGREHRDLFVSLIDIGRRFEVMRDTSLRLMAEGGGS
jgi:hypothetical protein